MVECLNGAPKRASWIEMKFDAFAWLCDGKGSEGDGERGGKMET